MAACVPATEPEERVEVSQLTAPLTYYPHQAGATWEYLEEGAPVNAVRVGKRVEGPTVVAGELWVKTRQVGLGFDIASYRQYRPEGVFELREERPGTIITFDPPLKRFPAEETLRVGTSWSGETTANLFFPEAKTDSQRTAISLEYVSTVVDKRTVNAPAGDFEVFVINFVSRTYDEEGNELESFTQEYWFSPFVGEVRTKEGYFLVAANFL